MVSSHHDSVVASATSPASRDEHGRPSRRSSLELLAVD